MTSTFASALLIIQAVVFAECRGPHHPRGEAVVKHHVHYRPTRENPEKMTRDAELLRDREHIQEHLEEMVERPDLTEMSDDELEFYYFRLHDADGNSMLDGLEILQAIQHTHHHPKHEEDAEDDVREAADPDAVFEYYVELIDRVLLEDDTDGDGYLSYQEYVIGRKKEVKTEETATASEPEASVNMI